MRRHLLSLIAFGITMFILTGSVNTHQHDTPQTIGIFRNALDMGGVTHDGAVRYDVANQTYAISGSGYGVGESDDAFHYLWNSVQGDFILRAEIHHENSSENFKSDVVYGWSVRNTISSDSEMLTISVSSSGGSAVSVRTEKGGSSLVYNLSGSSYEVIQLERVDGIYSVRLGAFGEPLIMKDIPDVNTMEETQLTDTPFLDDGSEYSPDGEYIFFNSNRTGAMQLWRMKPDGSEQTQLTFDENFNDWFPHISPDGEWILFISYGTDVASGDHPFYKHVTLRLMPLSGGEPTIVAYLYGGQGTINVPSWSPDSRYVAFVSNSGRFY